MTLTRQNLSLAPDQSGLDHRPHRSSGDLAHRSQAYPAPAFAELYHARWNIEEAFKVLKHRLYLEQFTGELPESIRQDVHAKIFTANLGRSPGARSLRHIAGGKSGALLSQRHLHPQLPENPAIRLGSSNVCHTIKYCN